MAPGKQKKGGVTHFKDHHTLARLFAAFVASLPDGHKFDYKRIAEFFGSGVTESAMEHRFRPARAHAKLMIELVKAGEDPGEYDFVDMNSTEIQALFGESTAEGVAFQFRSIKKGAEVLKTAVEEGASPVDSFAAFSQGAGGPPAASGTKRARAPRKPVATKRRRTAASSLAQIKPEDDDNEAQEMADTIALSRQQIPLAPAPAPISTAPGYPTASYHQPGPTWPAGPYSIAPIAGVAAAPVPDLPNGFTDPATGYGYNVAPPPLSRPASSHSSAMGMGFPDSRPGSSYSSGYYASPVPASSTYGTPVDTAHTNANSPYPQGGFAGSPAPTHGSYTGPNTNPSGGHYSPTYHHPASPSAQYDSHYSHGSYHNAPYNSADYNNGQNEFGGHSNPSANPAFPSAPSPAGADHYNYQGSPRPYSAHSYEAYRPYEQPEQQQQQQQQPQQQQNQQARDQQLQSSSYGQGQQEQQQDGWDAGDV